MNTTPQDPATTFLQAMLGRLAAHLLRIAPDRAFLEPLARALIGDALADPAAREARLAEAQREVEQMLRDLGGTFPLARLIAAHRLSRLEADLLGIALLPELDDRFGDVFLSIRGGAPPRRPTLGIALRALFDAYADRWRARRHLDRSPLWEAGLLRADVGRGEGHRILEPAGMDALLWPSAPVIAAAFGYAPSRLDTGAEVMILAPEERGEALRAGLAALAPELCRWIEAAQAGVVHLVCDHLADGVALAASLSRTFGRELVHVTAVARDPEAALQQAALCATMTTGLLLVELDAPDAPGGSGVASALRVPASFRPPGPVLIATPPRCEVSLPAGLPARRLELPRPRPGEQASLWREALAGRAGDVKVHVLANRTHLSAAQIRRTAARAAERAALAGRPAALHDDIVDALAETAPDPTSSLAHWTRPGVPWSRLVLDRETRVLLEELVQRVEHRVTVQDEWGMGGPGGRGEGLVAMFHGDPGTGKTLAAEAIAARLGLPLMRVDLSRVVSKYIGETEKHMASLFDAAEGFRCVLLFDEADTLFGKRTGVKDAHDRYANLETNYMLSRLEVFEGLALLATNLLQNVDTAFVRRLQFIVPFPRPTVPLKQRLWLTHLPRERLAPDVDIDALATRYDLVGGEIRNAALAAAFQAAATSSLITAAMLDHAIRAERLKAGKAVVRAGEGG